MATQFVKWWKTKFQARTHHSSSCAGYTTMSVLSSDGSDGRPSDTEDLLRDDGSSCHNGAHTNAGLASTASSDNSSICSNDHSHQQFSSNQVKFEDFECDVQVEGTESGEERKEFSFTFYDLDGHGKITKDDIAGLVRSIYGAVNDSITVPHGGKKTIKVRLTVTPEQQQQKDAADENLTQKTNLVNNNIPTADPETLAKVQMGCGLSANSGTSGVTLETTTTPTRTKLRNNVNVTIRENLNRHGGGSVRHRERRHEKPRFHSVRIPNGTTQNQQDCRGCRNLLPEVIRDCGASPMRHRKKWRERHCKPDLCDLVQANMEKNNVYHCCRNDSTGQPASKGQQPNPPSPLCTHNHLLDPNCPILPLLNNDKVLDGNNCSARTVKFFENSPGAKFLRGCKKHSHHRSRSHDLTENAFKYQFIGDNQYSSGTNAHCNSHHHQCSHEESLEILSGCVLNSAQQHPLSPRNKNTINNNKNILNKLTPVTPHQLKHRNREEDHARAMAQVINWLERENIGDKNSSAPTKPCFNFQQEYSRQIPAISGISKRQEHHHIHEHIHHHYHHHFAKETPIIV